MLFVPMARSATDLVPGGRILVVGDVKAAHIHARALYQSMFDTPCLTEAVRRSASREQLLKWFRQNRISGVLFNPGGAGYLRSQFGHYRWSARERRVLSSFWGSGLSPVRESREGGKLVMGLYRVGCPSSPGPALPVPGE
jgi:hypothetical protein